MEQMAWGSDGELTDNEFYNRTEDLNFISNLLNSVQYGSSPTILLIGLRRVGKTALIKKLEKKFNKDYLVSYIDLTLSNEYQIGKLNRIDIIKIIYDNIMQSCKELGIKTIDYKLDKLFKTNDFGIKSFVELKDIPIPILEKNENYSKLVNYIVDLPQKIYEDHKDEIKGVMIFIDEIQVLKDLNDDLNNFLWYLRNKIQFQKNVSYLFSGSMSTQDDLITDLSGPNGAFGGRILSINIEPFTEDTTYNYLKERLPKLLITDKGFKKFYENTNGIPFYINTFANLLPKNIELDEKDIDELFEKYLPLLINHYLIQWGKLTFQEQKILTSLLDKPLKRLEIADKLNVPSGSIGRSLNHLLDLVLIEFNGKKYQIIDSILIAWLKNSYEKRGLYPYREYIY